MPDEEMWWTFFDPANTLRLLGLGGDAGQVVDFGCGYGTFAVPAAQFIRGTVHAFDIEPEMIAETRHKAEREGLANIRCCLRDLIEEGTGLPDSSVDYVMLFNLLHAEQPTNLLREAFRIMGAGANVGIMHWNHDPKTPRGPSLDIRPRPTDCRSWALEAGFAIVNEHVDLPPYHYGIIAQKRLQG